MNLLVLLAALAALTACDGRLGGGPPVTMYDPSATAADVCVPGYATARRDVSYAERDRVYDAAGIPRGHRRGWRIDHVTPLELGGVNAEANLAPQRYAESREKDADENTAHDYACSGRMTLAQAREWLWKRWGAR